MSTGRMIAIIVGAALALMSLGMLVAGGALTFAYAVESDDGGYFDATLDRLATPTAAIDEDPRNRDIKIYVNGELFPRDEAKVSVYD